MIRKTKIVCTLGPASDSEEMISKLMDAGMNVCRLNMSHGSYEEQGARIDRIKRLRREKNIPVAIMLDTKGPEVRTKTLKADKVTLQAGQEFILTSRDIEGDETQVAITYPRMVELVHPGNRILIDDGLIALDVKQIKGGTDIVCSVVNGGVLGGRKGISVPDVDLQMPSIGEKDRSDIVFGIEKGIDLIAASFVCRPSDVLTLRKLCADNGGSHVQIFSKIENRMGVNNFDEILKVSDGIMVARGDLGVEVDMEEVPVLQKQFIHKCNVAAKPVITATQMLDSMIRNPRPTRAEVADVANAIYDGTDAVTLSGETAIGMYPVPAVQTMARIAEASESHIYDEGSIPNRNAEQKSISAVVGLAAVTAAENVGACCIVTPTMTGRTARIVSNYRPKMPIYAVTTSEEYRRSLQLNWGVTPLLGKVVGDASYVLEQARSVVVKKNFVNKGDICVFTLGDRTTSPRISQTGDAVSFDPTAPSPRPTNVMQIVQIGVEAEGDN